VNIIQRQDDWLIQIMKSMDQQPKDALKIHFLGMTRLSIYQRLSLFVKQGDTFLTARL